MSDIKQELMEYELHCLQGDQLQVAELASNARVEIEKLQARIEELEHFAEWVIDYYDISPQIISAYRLGSKDA